MAARVRFGSSAQAASVTCEARRASRPGNAHTRSGLKHVLEYFRSRSPAHPGLSGRRRRTRHHGRRGVARRAAVDHQHAAVGARSARRLQAVRSRARRLSPDVEGRALRGHRAHARRGHLRIRRTGARHRSQAGRHAVDRPDRPGAARRERPRGRCDRRIPQARPGGHVRDEGRVAAGAGGEPRQQPARSRDRLFLASRAGAALHAAVHRAAGDLLRARASAVPCIAARDRRRPAASRLGMAHLSGAGGTVPAARAARDRERGQHRGRDDPDPVGRPSRLPARALCGAIRAARAS